jgi:type II secretory ATPase GspE/PulE/Tfp pilus assembly ATPase PilB-like protein
MCNGSGAKGRIGIFEMMDYNEDLKQMLIEGKGAIEVERLALQK